LFRASTDLIKISYNLIEKSQALDTLIVAIKLDIKFTEVVDGSEDHANTRVALMIQLLGQSILPGTIPTEE
jgi:hypothetical protein